MRLMAIATCMLLSLLSYRTASADIIFEFDPGTVGQQFTGFWSTQQFNLDEPLSTVRFKVVDGKLINLIPNSGLSWRFNFTASNLGLSQNFVASKTMRFLDANGGTLFTFSDPNPIVATQTESITATRNSPLLSIAAIEVQYAPNLTQVGPNATVSLSFNNRSSNGVLQVTAVPESSSMIMCGMALTLLAYRRFRHVTHG